MEIIGMILIKKENVFMDKKKRDQMKNRLTSTQEVRYQKEFKAADRAAGFTGAKGIRP